MDNPDDPNGLLHHAPGLLTLMHHLAVRHAVASGDAEQLHQALRDLWSRGRNDSERNTAASLLDDPRLFVTPLTLTPVTRSWLGCGTRLCFASKPEGATHITTRCLVLFHVPLFPLGQYLVHQDGGPPVFLGRVPFSAVMRVWRNVGWLVLGGAAAFVVLVAAQLVR